MDSLERAIRPLTSPINGQLPRPWMTDLTDPREALVFIVGKNQRSGYPATASRTNGTLTLYSTGTVRAAVRCTTR
jgi:hypothetical protein